MSEANSMPAPPPATRRFVRYVLSFGISVAIGLAPFLGQVDVPLFEPLLNILPPAERSVAVPIAATLMGIVAVVVQWHAYDRVRRHKVKRLFISTVALAVFALLAFFVVNAMTVTRMPVGRDDTAVVLHGFGEPRCEVCAGKSNIECLRHISLDPGRVEACWGSSQVRIARISLTLTYFAATALFGALVGLLVVGTSGESTKKTPKKSRRL